MLSRWLRPDVLLVVAILSIVANLAAPEVRPWSHAAVYALAGWLCIEVASDYDHRLMRLSWLLFSAEAWVLALHFPLFDPRVAGFFNIPADVYTGLPFVQVELACLLTGMALTWWQLRQFGLGFHALRRDWIGVAVILAGMVAFFTLSARGGWMFPLMAITRALLFLSACVAVLLNRFCQQMGGGEIARVFRFLIAYVATRCFMNVVFAMNKTLGPVARELEELLNVVFPWIFLFGVTLRARVAVRAKSELAIALTSGASSAS